MYWVVGQPSRRSHASRKSLVKLCARANIEFIPHQVKGRKGIHSSIIKPKQSVIMSTPKTSASDSGLNVFINTTVTSNHSGISFTDHTIVVEALEAPPASSIPLPQGQEPQLFTQQQPGIHPQVPLLLTVVMYRRLIPGSGVQLQAGSRKLQRVT